MTAKKNPREPELEFHCDGPGRGVFRAIWPVHHVRYLLSDGSTIDCLSTSDDSDLRAAVLRVTGVERIEGSTRVIGADWGDGRGSPGREGRQAAPAQPRLGEEGNGDAPAQPIGGPGGTAVP